MPGLWDIVTYPLMLSIMLFIRFKYRVSQSFPYLLISLLGLCRGAFLTYQSLEKDDKTKRQQLEYWVVISALLFLFPWIEYILSFFLFGGLVGAIKLGLLFMVVVSKARAYGFLYKLIEDQFIPLIDPYINDWITKTQDIRCQICGTVALWLPMALRSVSKVLIKSCSEQHLYYLTKSLNKMQAKMMKDITKEQELRKLNQSEERGATKASSSASGQTEETEEQ